MHVPGLSRGYLARPAAAAPEGALAAVFSRSRTLGNEQAGRPPGSRRRAAGRRRLVRVPYGDREKNESVPATAPQAGRGAIGPRRRAVSIGEVLAVARSQAGLTITQVSQRTRIRETLIRGIEEDDFAARGGDFYAPGHIRAIARAAGVDGEPLVRQYDSSHRRP
jgi:Helix-turn-helix domain